MRKEAPHDWDVVVVGGGPSATHLLNSIDQSPDMLPMSILILDSAVHPEGGTPHADSSTALRVNMAESKHDFAGQMSFAEFREMFGGDHKPALRADLARYCFHVKDNVVRSLIRKGFQIASKRQRAISLTREHSEKRGRWKLTLQNGEQITAQNVILATGHNRPSLPPNVRPVDGITERISYYDGRASFAKDLASDDRVLILGTGPGATDAARIAIEDVGVDATIFLASTHGMISAVQCTEPPSPEILGDVEDYVRVIENGEPLSLPQLSNGLHQIFARHAPGFDYSAVKKTPPDALLALVRCMGEAQENMPARETLEAIGAAAPRIWRRLTEDAKAEFLRDHKRIYMVNRHAMPRPTAMWLAARLAENRMHIAQTLAPIEVSSDAVLARLRLLPGGEKEMTFDRLVVATGPEYLLSRCQSPLIRQVLQTGLARTASIGGREVGGFLTKDFELVGMEGVYAMGSLVYGEDLAIHSFPALTRHGRLIAGRVSR
jgi:uncharacterized NAD(P)/FAD-binding protein YdhS